MHLVGFTIEIYYNARPYERKIRRTCRTSQLHSTNVIYPVQIVHFILSVYCV